MGADINAVLLVGRLTRDAELKFTGGGTAVCSGSIAVNRRVKKGDTWEDQASFFDIQLWGKRAESLSPMLTKGKQIGVKGELRQERWQANDGQNRSRVVISVDDVQLFGGRGDAGGSNPQGGGHDNEPDQAAYGDAPDFDDDIPF